MDPETNDTAAANPDAAATTTDRLAEATQSLADALQSINAQFESLHAKIDKIVAAVDDGTLHASVNGAMQSGAAKLAELEKTNLDLKAQAARAQRKTLSPLISTLLAKQGVEGDSLIETPVVEKALAGLSIEQRIAVKSELARAGILV